MVNERRRCVRLSANEDAFAFSGFRFSWVGAIKDISTGGLSFEHVADINPNGVPRQEVDLFISGSTFHLPDLPCSIVYDKPVPSQNKDYSFNTDFRNRRCGVQFGALTENQIMKINSFLEYHTKAVDTELE